MRLAPAKLAAGLLALSCLAGCRAPSDAPPAARIDGRTLTVDALAHWMVLGQPLPLDSATAHGLARHWVEVTAVVQALARGTR